MNRPAADLRGLPGARDSDCLNEQGAPWRPLIPDPREDPRVNLRVLYSATSFSLAVIFSLMRADLPERPRM